MFEIGFSELFLIGIVALVVLGPERLPKAARFAGLWVRRARAQWYSVKGELERELAAEELQRSLRETREAARDFEGQMRDTQSLAQREFERMQAQVSGRDAHADVDADSAADFNNDDRPALTSPDIGGAENDDGTTQGERDVRG